MIDGPTTAGSYALCLNFHGVGAPGRELEHGEAPYWISEAFFQDILAAVQESPRRTMITFDDGNLSDLEICAPALASRRLAATFFALAGRLGSKGSLGPSHLRSLAGMGMDIGNHGHDHTDWTKLDPAGFERELRIARTKLEDASGRKISAAAIPFGRYGKRVLDELESAGYAEVFTSDGGHFTASRRIFPRTSVRSDMGIADIRRIVAGGEPMIRSVRRRLGMAKRRFF
jgi:peptidoglycan/xylan/chitin deacetylase (PgdA/CDA1 family)